MKTSELTDAALDWAVAKAEGHKMKYYVLGYHEGNLIVMTSREFSTLEEANNYAASVARAWKAFAVGGRNAGVVISQTTELIEKHRDINVDHDWWEHVYDWFVEDMAAIGIHVEEMYFRGFWSPGDGACFEGYVENWPVFLAAHGTHNPVLAAHAKGNFSFSCKHTRHYCHENSVSYDYDLPVPESSIDTQFAETYSPYPAVDDLRTSAWLAVLNQQHHDRLLDDLKDTFRSHMQDLYKRLEGEYEHLTSDEVVWEAIIANDLDKENNDENE